MEKAEESRDGREGRTRRRAGVIERGRRGGGAGVVEREGGEREQVW